MAPVLNLLQPVARQLHIRSIDIANNVFQLHTKLTVALLIAGCALHSGVEFVGLSIDCAQSADANRKRFYDNLCWINGTYTVSTAWEGQQGVHYTALGVGALRGGGLRSSPAVAVQTWHGYYQWVNLMLLLAAALSYVPRYLWQYWEHGLMEALCKGLGRRDEILAACDGNVAPIQQRRHAVVRYLRRDDNALFHRAYALRFFACEWLNLLCVLANMLLLEVCFDGGFWLRFAPAIAAVASRDYAAWTRATAVVFPKQTKCDYFEWGPSGGVERRDLVCVLALNVLNEKLFAVLWVWLPAVAAVSALNVLWRAVCCGSLAVRVRLLKAQTFAAGTPVAEEVWEAMCRGGGCGGGSSAGTVGEWFVLHQLGRNVHPRVFGAIMVALADGGDGGGGNDSEPSAPAETTPLRNNPYRMTKMQLGEMV